MVKIEVFNTIIKLELPDEFLAENMHKFYCNDSQSEDILIGMTKEPMPVSSEALNVHTVHKLGGRNYYMMSKNDSVTHFKFDDDYSCFFINLNESINLEGLNEKEIAALAVCINSALRRIFIMVVAEKGGVCLHSSTIQFDGEAICFSASSGTGKTTHTDLWSEVYPAIQVINGDMCYLFIDGGNPCFYGSPWCGTSGECKNVIAPVKTIVFLEQAKENVIQKLSIPEAFMRISTKCFMPLWDKKLNLKAINTTELLSEKIPCYLLRCLPNKDAARVCYNGIY